jgi:hypothetical protein
MRNSRPRGGIHRIVAAATKHRIALSLDVTDQPGVSRPQGAACDAGAHEIAQPPPAQPTPVNGRVTQGSVNARDGVRKTTILLRAGKRYTARPRR